MPPSKDTSLIDYIYHASLPGGALYAAPRRTGVTSAWCSQPSSAGRAVQVFFIRDGVQFVDLVHALRPNPKTNVQEGWRILDFLSHHPESVHIVRRPSHLHPMHAGLASLATNSPVCCCTPAEA